MVSFPSRLVGRGAVPSLADGFYLVSGSFSGGLSAGFFMKLSLLGCSVLGALVALVFPGLLLSLLSPGSVLGSTCFPFLPCSPGPFSGQGAAASPGLILFPSLRKSLLPEVWYLQNCCLSLLGLLQQNTRGIKPVNPK